LRHSLLLEVEALWAVLATFSTDVSWQSAVMHPSHIRWNIRNLQRSGMDRAREYIEHDED